MPRTIIFTGWHQWPGRPTRDLCQGSWGDCAEDGLGAGQQLAAQAWSDLRTGLYKNGYSDGEVDAHLRTYGLRYVEAVEIGGRVVRCHLHPDGTVEEIDPRSQTLPGGRYLAFMGIDTYPMGGLRDCVAYGDTWDRAASAALDAACTQRQAEDWKTLRVPGMEMVHWWQVVDTETVTVLAQETLRRTK